MEYDQEVGDGTNAAGPPRTPSQAGRWVVTDRGLRGTGNWQTVSAEARAARAANASAGQARAAQAVLCLASGFSWPTDWAGNLSEQRRRHKQSLPSPYFPTTLLWHTGS